MRTAFTTLVATIGILLSLNQLVGAEPDKMTPVRAALTSYILPNFERFSEQTEQMMKSVDTLCTSANAANLNIAKKEFRLSILAWGRVEFLRFGPLMKNNRLERLMYWPDRKSIGLKQIQRALAEQDPTFANNANISSKSIALQGFGALEYLLFGKGHLSLAQNTDEYRCAFAASVAQNIHLIAKQVSDEWSNEDGFSTQWLSPDKNNPRYYDENESLGELVGSVAQAFELIRNLRLKPIWLKVEPNVNHKRAIFWRSGMIFPLLRSNFEGLKTLIDVSGLVSILPKNDRWIGGSLEFTFSNIGKTIATITLPLQQAVRDPEQASDINYLVILSRALQSLVGEQLVGALDLPIGFSPLDGDG